MVSALRVLGLHSEKQGLEALSACYAWHVLGPQEISALTSLQYWGLPIIPQAPQGAFPQLSPSSQNDAQSLFVE